MGKLHHIVFLTFVCLGFHFFLLAKAKVLKYFVLALFRFNKTSAIGSSSLRWFDFSDNFRWSFTIFFTFNWLCTFLLVFFFLRFLFYLKL